MKNNVWLKYFFWGVRFTENKNIWTTWQKKKRKENGTGESRVVNKAKIVHDPSANHEAF